MKHNLNTKKALYALYAAGAVLGASFVSGCGRTVYLNPDGTPYTPTYRCTPTSTGDFKSNVPSQVVTGILQGIAAGL